MNRHLIRTAQRLWPNSKHNRRQWIRSVQQLGSKWLLAVPVRRCHENAA